MLVFHTHCQMGNQMFMYACAKSLAYKRKLHYCLSNLEALKYFELTSYDKTNNLRYFVFKLQNKIPLLRYKFLHLQEQRISHAKDMLYEKQKRVWYYGYFQGEDYLYDNWAKIKNCFKIKIQYTLEFNQLNRSEFSDKRLIAVHIRQKDYKTFGPDFLNGPDLSLPFAYYKNVLTKILNNQPDNNYRIAILSDDLDAVKHAFQEWDCFYSSENMITDFQILQHAHTAIISPSSFAWWACMLSPLKNQQVHVPEYFLGFKVKKEFPVNMIPPNFIKEMVQI